MKDEPEYVFIKGEGWRPSGAEPSYTHDVMSQDGEIRRVTIIDRAPFIGESGWYVPPNLTLRQTYEDVIHFLGETQDDKDVAARYGKLGWVVRRPEQLKAPPLYKTITVQSKILINGEWHDE